MSLPTRALGRNGPQVTAIGFGAMGLSAFYGKPPPDPERFAMLDKTFELGERFWDSADAYADNEELIGKWFAKTGNRDKVFLATKFSIFVNPDGSRTIRGDAPYVKEACAKSLKRLGIDTIDLYYAHRTDPNTPIEETVGAMAELVKEGKVRYLGLSECSAETLRRAHKVHPISAVQVEYSPFYTGIESAEVGLKQACEELGVAIVAYAPLGRGMLTGKYKKPSDFGDEHDWRRNGVGRYSEENFPKNLELVDRLEKIAEKKGCTSGQLSMAWLLAQSENVIPIPGTTKVKNLEENLGALQVKITPEENAEIRKAVDEAEEVGDRYPEAVMAGLFVNTPLPK